MASITITKPAKWAWNSASIVDPDDAANLYCCEPFWAEDDWEIPATTTDTHSDLTGSKTLSFINNGSTFAWDSDANVGAFIKRTASAGNHGLRGPTSEFDSSNTKFTYIIVFHHDETDESGVKFFGGLQRYGLGIDLATDQIIIQNNNLDEIYRSTLTIPRGEWHILGVRFDNADDVVSLCLDGATPETDDCNLFAVNTNTRFEMFGSTHGSVSLIEKLSEAFGALWTDWLDDTRFQALCNPNNGHGGPYRLLKQASEEPSEVEGTGTATIGDFTSEGEGDAGTPSVEGAGSSTIGDFVSEGEGEAVTAGTITTEPLKNNTGTVWANQTGATVYVYDPDTGELVVSLTEQTTDASGVMTITDPLIVGGTEYRVVIVLSSGAEGMDRITAT